ncbi:hypothetical protein [Sphingorhabdus sp.]|uniref:hypothetical protein n=1 Tax=Sphingorhabdus sp. TaxID=1902408 RepID=UPI0033419708
MSVRIIHKKSETTGAVPTITDLTTGEFGVNAADGDVFIRILMDPAGVDTLGNQRILSVRRPLYADGGVITAPSLGILRLLTETGDNLVTAANDYIDTDGAAPTTAAFKLQTEAADNLITATGDYINTDYN